MQRWPGWVLLSDRMETITTQVHGCARLTDEAHVHENELQTTRRALLGDELPPVS